MLDLKALLTKILQLLIVKDISASFTFTSAWTGMVKKAFLVGGKLVVFALEGNAGTIVGGTQYTMAQVASPYKPSTAIPHTGHVTNASYVATGFANCWVWADGDITIRASNGNGNYVFFTGWYILK